LRSAMPDADFLQNLHLYPLLGVMRTRFAQPELFRVYCSTRWQGKFGYQRLQSGW
jgi:hypothetical protein